MVTIDTIMSKNCSFSVSVASGSVTACRITIPALHLIDFFQDDIYEPVCWESRAAAFTLCSLFTANEQGLMIMVVVSRHPLEFDGVSIHQVLP